MQHLTTPALVTGACAAAGDLIIFKFIRNAKTGPVRTLISATAT